MGGQMERAHSEDGTHDVVAGQTQLDYVVAPERPDAGVGGEGGVSLGGEVVKEFEFEHRKLCAVNECRRWRVMVCGWAAGR